MRDYPSTTGDKQTPDIADNAPGMHREDLAFINRASEFAHKQLNNFELSIAAHRTSMDACTIGFGWGHTRSYF